MKVTFKTYKKPSNTIIEYNSNYNWRNLVKEVNKSKKCDVYVCLDGKTKLSFDFCTENVTVNYHDIPEGCEEFSYITKTICGRTFYSLRMTKRINRAILSQYIEAVFAEHDITDIDVDVLLEIGIDSIIK